VPSYATRTDSLDAGPKSSCRKCGRFAKTVKTTPADRHQVQRKELHLPNTEARMVCGDAGAYTVALTLASVRENGARLRGTEFNQAIAELLQHRLISIMPEDSVYSVNRKYFKGSNVVSFVAVYDRKKKGCRLKDHVA
jgi:hypothetical protein